MEFLKKSIHMDQIGCEEQTQITLEDDVNIADAKPDVYQVVTQQGHVELEEVRASDGHVHVKGVLHFKVLYLADEETHHPACMEGELAFEEQILMGSVSGTDQVQAQAILEDLSVGMINSRKLSVQALLQIRLFTERMKQLDVAVGLDGTEQIEVKKKDLQALDLIVAKKDILRVKKDLLLPGGMPNILRCCGNPARFGKWRSGCWTESCRRQANFRCFSFMKRKARLKRRSGMKPPCR